MRTEPIIFKYSKRISKLRKYCRCCHGWVLAYGGMKKSWCRVCNSEITYDKNKR